MTRDDEMDDLRLDDIHRRKMNALRGLHPSDPDRPDFDDEPHNWNAFGRCRWCLVLREGSEPKAETEGLGAEPAEPGRDSDAPNQ